MVGDRYCPGPHDEPIRETQRSSAAVRGGGRSECINASVLIPEVYLTHWRAAMKSYPDDRSGLTATQILYGVGGIAVVYWFFETVIQLLWSTEVHSFAFVLLGGEGYDLLRRIVVLFLFLVLGFHLQFNIKKRLIAEAAYEDVRQEEKRLMEISQALSSELSLSSLLMQIMDTGKELIGADRCTLFLYDRQTDELWSHVAHGLNEGEVRFSADLGIAGETFRQGKAIIINDAYADPRFNPQVDQDTGYTTRNILSAPIRTKGQGVVGVTQVLNKHSGGFTEEDQYILEVITSQTATALLNAQLHDQVSRAREEEAQLLKITTELSSELNLLRLLAKIMETTKDILSADRCTLFMYDDKYDELWSQVAHGLEFKEIRIPSHAGIAGTVFSTGETINIPDAYEDDRFNKEIDRKTGYHTRSILCMPVKNKDGRIIGVTQVLNKSKGPFTAIDENRLEAFSAQASIAIENAKLFDDVLNMKNYNESMLESMSNGVISLDAEGCVVTCNAAALGILGESTDHLSGEMSQEFFSGANQWVLDAVDRVRETGEPYLAMDTDLVLADTSEASVNLNAVPLISGKRDWMGTLLLLEDITSEKRLKGTMARYMTKEVVDRLLEGGESVLGGQSQPAAVFFSDIRGFTGISERIGPQETVSMLNEYFTIMVDVIFRHQGILDKYIGDAIMAVFGAPLTTGRDSDNAVKTAIEMMTALRQMNERRTRDEQIPIDIGIGICTDEVVSGNIGSLKRMDYTVIGDGVNLASRLEGANKVFGTNILISESTYQGLQDRYATRLIDRIRVKGKIKPVGVYQVLDYHDPSTFPHMEEVLGLFRQGLDHYGCQEWDAGIALFEQALALNSADRVSRLYLDRCHHYRDNPPNQDWDGVCVMETK